MATKHSRPSQAGTPGRRYNVAGNQYFDIGRVGRKTGITLKDTGIRDDYGLEPVSGIFSSGGSRTSSYSEDDGSAEMSGLDSPSMDVTDTLHRRSDPRFSKRRSPEHRQSKTAVSPGRQSSVLQESPASRQLGNRHLQLESEHVRQSIEKQSPFKPRHVLRRSSIGPQPQQAAFRKSLSAALPDFSPFRTPGSVQQFARRQRDGTGSSPLFVQSDESDLEGEVSRLPFATGDEIEGALGDAGDMLLTASPATPKKRQREGDADRSNSVQRHLPAKAASKRPRYTESEQSQDEELDDDQRDKDEQVNESRASAAAPVPDHQSPAAPHNEPQYDNYNYEQNNDYDDDDDNNNDAGSFGVPDPESERDVSEQPEPSPVKVQYRPQANGTGKGKGRVPPPRRVPVQRAQRAQSYDSVSSVPTSSDSESGSEYGGKQKRTFRGPRSNVNYRATTPFDDAGQQTTRSGRPIMKPLNWWEGEAVIWKNGEVDGVIRATSVEPERRVVKKRAQHKKKTKKIKEGLDAIEEQGEDQLPDEWEEEVGVMTGEMAPWNRELNAATEEELVTEDIAFAASSITLRSLEGKSSKGASFKYAKIQTLPFFGSGVVEIPPGGEKDIKNSRKMQMNFFVHKGKVQVTLATPTTASTSIFNITEGGAWVVPRGNSYMINNHSSSTTAFLFFSQGCEVPAEDAAG